MASRTKAKAATLEEVVEHIDRLDGDIVALKREMAALSSRLGRVADNQTTVNLLSELVERVESMLHESTQLARQLHDEVAGLAKTMVDSGG